MYKLVRATFQKDRAMKIATCLLAAALTLAACATAPSGPPGQPSSTDVNPITGSRGGSGTR